MREILRRNEPIRNEFRKKIIVIAEKLYGTPSKEVKNMARLLYRYKFSMTELIKLLKSLESEFFNKSDCNFDDYDKQFERIVRNSKKYKY